jgi:hypothetical protein
MYALGDVPLILQGAGQREKLSPEQAARVGSMVAERGGTPVLSPARVGVSPVLVYAGLGLVAAYLIASGRSRGGLSWG